MEAKLKKQRNKLFLRIILILLAVWLTVSVVFCAIRLNIEKANVQNRESSGFSYAKQLLLIGDGSIDSINHAILDVSDFIYEENEPYPRFEGQVILTDRNTQKLIADTADSICLRMNGILETGSVMMVCTLNYHTLRDSLTDEQLKTIENYLNTERDDGSYYELTCTKFQGEIQITPLELEIVLVNKSDERLTMQDKVEVFDLSANYVEGQRVYQTGAMRRNTIPKSFLFGDAYNKDYISALTPDQRKQTAKMIRTGAFEYLYYASDYLHFDEIEGFVEADDWYLQYAHKVDLLSNCKGDLALGVAIIFVFFFTIAFILCVMIWRTVKAQIIQEQKRIELTGALAHDIKTPLFVISGYAYSLKEGIDEDERDVYLDKIIEQTDEVNSLVHRMLDFSKLDSYNMTLHKTDFDLSELAQDIADDHVSLPDRKSIVFTHSGDNTINADRELVKTALQNLTDNAIQYSLPDSEILIDVSDKRFSIGNRAEPLTKAEIKQIRQPYMRKDKSRSKKGNGLGLSIVQSIAEQHDARFDMEMKGDLLTCSLTFSS